MHPARRCESCLPASRGRASFCYHPRLLPFALSSTFLSIFPHFIIRPIGSTAPIGLIPHSALPSSSCRFYPRLLAVLSPFMGYLILTYSGFILHLWTLILRATHCSQQGVVTPGRVPTQLVAVCRAPLLAGCPPAGRCRVTLSLTFSLAFPIVFPSSFPDLVIRPISPIAPIGLIFVLQTIMTARRYAMSHFLFEPAEAPHVISRYDDLG